MGNDDGCILVIDDSWVILDRVRAALSAEGYQVSATTESVGAAKHLRGCDLVIIDFHMPGIDGKFVLNSLRRAGAASPTCLYYLYTSDPEVARRSGEFGFDGSFLHKGNEALLVPQVSAVFRTIRMRKLATKMREDKRARSGGLMSRAPKADKESA